MTPNPTPQITVGCIVKHQGFHMQVEAIGRGRAWCFNRSGSPYGQPELSELTFVAASWDEVPE